MADNIDVTPGSGKSIAADDIGGGLLAQRVKPVWGADGTGTDVSAAAPMPVAGAGALVEVVPTITAGAYDAGDVVGGIMTFSNILPATYCGLLASLTLKFKGTVQTTQFDVALFNASPAGTFTDNSAPAIATADSAKLIGVFNLGSPISSLGTHTIYCLDGISKQIIGVATSLYAVVITKSAPTVNPASTSDMLLSIGMAW